MRNSYASQCSRTWKKYCLASEIEHINKVLTLHAYPKKVLDKALLKAKKTHYTSLKNFTESTSFKKKEVLVLPFVPCLEKSKAPFTDFNVKLVFSQQNKLLNKLTKNKPSKNVTQGIYEIPCRSCNGIYHGETGQGLNIRIKQHRRDIAEQKPHSALATHVREADHPFDFNKARIVYPCSNTNIRHIIESALIRKYSSLGLSINSNNGFSPHNYLLSKYILEVSNLSHVT